MKYYIITNNPLVKDYADEHDEHDAEFITGSVQKVISRCEEIFIEGYYSLAADPMGGRRARPFPYLTVILKKTGNTGIGDWNRLADYSELNGKRIAKYECYGESLLQDYRILDYSLTKTALNNNMY